MDASIRAISSTGTGITFRIGRVVDILEQLHAQSPMRALFSHREVGNGISLERDRQVAEWAGLHNIRWMQFEQDGVSDIRHSELDEGSWAKKWTAKVSAPSRLRCVPAQVSIRLHRASRAHTDE